MCHTNSTGIEIKTGTIFQGVTMSFALVRFFFRAGVGSLLALTIGAQVLAVSPEASPEASSTYPVMLAAMDAAEPYDAMVFHAGYLWVGQSRKGFSPNYRVTIFNRDDHRVYEAQLKHTAATIQPYGPDAVIVTGTAAEPNLTAWSIVRASPTGFQVEHHWIPMEAWANGWLGSMPGKEFFLDMGGNYDDPDGSNDPQLPAQTIFTTSRSGVPTYLKVRMRAPISGFKHGNQFIILRKDNISLSDARIVILDPSTGAVHEPFGQKFDRPGEAVVLPDGERLVVAESNRGLVHFVNLKTGEKSQFETGGSPKGLAVSGNCLMVGMEAEKKGLVLKAPVDGQVEVVGSFDFNSFGVAFRGLRRIASDSATGRVYGLSVYACNPNVQDCSKTWNAVVATPRASRAGFLEKCAI